jgi:hypothetical protein
MGCDVLSSGGRVKTGLAVTPGAAYYVYVGCAGSSRGLNVLGVKSGGFNGGAFVSL